MYFAATERKTIRTQIHNANQNMHFTIVYDKDGIVTKVKTVPIFTRVVQSEGGSVYTAQQLRAYLKRSEWADYKDYRRKLSKAKQQVH